MTALSGGAPKQAPRWDLVAAESCGGGIRFLAPVLIVWGYVCIYRRKEYVGGAPRGPQGRGARLGGAGAPPPWWTGRGPPDVDLPSSIFYTFQNNSPLIFRSFRDFFISAQK